VNAIAPGWYRDPADTSTQRYWDGEGWVGDPLPADVTPPAEPPSAPVPAAVKPEEKPAEEKPPLAEQPAGWPPGLPWPPPGAQVPPGYQFHPAYAQLFLPAPRPHGYPLAAPGRRFAARMVDIGILLVVNAVVNGWFIYKLYQEFWPYFKVAFARTQAKQPTDDIPIPQNTDTLALTIVLIAAALWFAYEVPAVANRGQTFGKRLFGIKVLGVEADGPLGFGRAFRRWNPMGFATVLWVCGGVGFVFQFIDCLFVAVDRPLHQALHDKQAATVVVDVHNPADKTGDTQT